MRKETGFIRRWSQRKLRAKREALADDHVEPKDDREKMRTGALVERLPPIDQMTAESDFSVFLQAGVPDDLRTAALRKLWRLDPAFGRLDGLLEYGDDYNNTGTVTTAVKTAYRIGRGFAGPEANSQDAGPLQEAEAEGALQGPTAGQADVSSKVVESEQKGNCGGNMTVRGPVSFRDGERSKRSDRGEEGRSIEVE